MARKLVPALAICAASFGVGFGSAWALRRGDSFGTERAGPTQQVPARPPGPRTMAASTAAEDAFQRGFRALEEERHSDAVASFRQAAALDASDPRPHHGLGKAYQKMALIELAERSFRTAIEIDPESTASENDLATLLHDSGRYEEALALLETLRAKNPGDHFVTAEIGINELALGHVEAAIRHLEEYNAAVGPQPWGATNLGRALEAAGDDTRAEASYREALRSDPAFGIALHLLGQLLARTGREDESRRALESYRQLRELETTAHQLAMALLRQPDDVDSLMRLANIRFRLGKAKEALILVDRARGIRPGDPAIEAIREQVATAARAEEARGR